LFQFLKLFKSDYTVWGALYIPGMVMAFLFLMPLLGRARIGHILNVGVILGLIVGALILTGIAVVHDTHDDGYNHAVRAAEKDAERVRVLADRFGVPPVGARSLLRDDPYTQGPKLFSRYCASCHRFGQHDGTGAVPKEPPSASDLKGFASREWIRGLLDADQIDQPHYFGASRLKDGEMARFVKKDVSAYKDEQKQMLAKVIVALSAEAELPSQAELDKRDASDILAGQPMLKKSTAESPGLNCVRCHRYRDSGKDDAPDLTGYGSKKWIVGIISDPIHEMYYPESNDRMPRFGAQGILDATSIELIADWIRGEWYQPAVAK
jgi:ubiquinol-cytochrome c reductase cytochrome b subunit